MPIISSVLTVNTVEDAEMYVIETSIDNVVIPANNTSTTLSSAPKAYFKKITGSTISSQDMRWKTCWRSGSSYELISQSSTLTNQITLPTTFYSSKDAIVIFAKYSSVPTTESYDVKKEIVIQKRGDTGSPGSGAAYIHLKGTGLNNQQTAVCEVFNGSSLTTRSVNSTGLYIYKINRTSLDITHVGRYDVYNTENDCHEFAVDLADITSDYFACIISYDAVRWTSEMIETLTEFGSLGVNDTTPWRVPFAFIGQKGLAQGQAMQVQSGQASTDPPAEIVVYVNNGVMATSKEPTAGKVGGRFYYNGGVYDDESTVSYYVTDKEAPYFLFDGEYWVFEPAANGTYTQAQMGAPSSDDSNWHLMFYNEQKFFMSDVMFAQYAHLASFVFNGDWQMSTNGQVDDVSYNWNTNFSGNIFCGTSGALFSVKAYTMFEGTNPLGEPVVVSEYSGTPVTLAYNETKHTIYYGYFKKDKTYKFTCTGKRNNSSYAVYVRIRRSSNDEVSSPTMYPYTSDYTSDWGSFRVVADGYYYIEMYQDSTGSGRGGVTSYWKLSESYFRPNLAIDGMTGNTYQGSAYLRGEVYATNGTFNGEVYATNGTFNGVLKARLMYASTKNLLGLSTYTVDIENDPYYSFYLSPPVAGTTITLPNATTYDGLELRFFSALITRNNGYGILTYSGGIKYDAGSGELLGSATSVYLRSNQFVTVKAMQSVWYVVSGTVTT